MRSPRTSGMVWAALLVPTALFAATELAAPGAACTSLDVAAPLVGPEFNPNPPFRLDDAGNVYHLDSSFGRIKVNGHSRNWRPDDDHPLFRVSPAGEVFYEDSFGRLRKNGFSYNYDFRREGSFHIDDAGNLYWVKDWVDEEIYKNASGTDYEIKDGSHWHVYRDGTIAWISQDGKLHLNGQEAPITLRPGLFYRDWRGDFWYVVHIQANRWRLLRYDRSTGQVSFEAMLPNRNRFQMDRQGVVWYSGYDHKIYRDGSYTGWKGHTFRLDRFSRCFHMEDGKIYQEGEDLGYSPDGYFFDVSGDGDVFWFKDEDRGVLYRNDQKLSFKVK